MLVNTQWAIKLDTGRQCRSYSDAVGHLQFYLAPDGHLQFYLAPDVAPGIEDVTCAGSAN